MQPGNTCEVVGLSPGSLSSDMDYWFPTCDCKGASAAAEKDLSSRKNLASRPPRLTGPDRSLIAGCGPRAASALLPLVPLTPLEYTLKCPNAQTLKASVGSSLPAVHPFGPGTNPTGLKRIAACWAQVVTRRRIGEEEW